MKCLRCGWCCHNCLVVIIKDKDRGVKEDNLIVHNGNGSPCPHLRGDGPGIYACDIHDEDWYDQTPCHSHGQIEASVDAECRMGRYLLDKEKDEDRTHP